MRRRVEVNVRYMVGRVEVNVRYMVGLDLWSSREFYTLHKQKATTWSCLFFGGGTNVVFFFFSLRCMTSSTSSTSILYSY